MNDKPINNNFFAGYLHSTFRSLPGIIVREVVVEWGSPAHKAIERLVEKELKAAVEAERKFSK